MPISFQAADPFSPQVSFETGQRQQMQQEYENYLQAQRAASQNYFQQAHLDQADQHFDANMGMQQQRFDESNRQFEAQRQPSERDRFLGEQEIKQMKAKADIQVMTAGMEITQKQKLEFEQKKNAVAEMRASKELTEPQKADGISKLMTGITETDRQLKNEQAKKLAEATKMQIQQAEQQAKLQTRTNEFLAKNAPGSTFEIPGYGMGLVQPGGKIDFHAAPKPEKPDFSPRDMMTMYNKAVQVVDGVRDQSGNIVPGTGMLKSGPAGSEVWAPGVREQQIEIELGKLQELSSAGQHKPQAPSQPTGVQPGVQSAQAPPVASSQPPQPPAAPPVQPPPQAAPRPAPAPPLPPDRAAWKPEQVQLVDAGEREVKKLDAMRSPDMKAAAANLAEAMKIYRETGGQPAVSPEMEKAYAYHMNQYRSHLAQGSR